MRLFVVDPEKKGLISEVPGEADGGVERFPGVAHEIVLVELIETLAESVSGLCVFVAHDGISTVAVFLEDGGQEQAVLPDRDLVLQKPVRDGVS